MSQESSHSLGGQSLANLMMDTLFVNNLLILKGKNDLSDGRLPPKNRSIAKEWDTV